MIIYCFSSEDFRPKRLVYEWKLGDGADVPDTAGGKEVPAKKRSEVRPVQMTPQQKERYRANLEQGRIRKFKLNELKKVIDEKIKEVKAELNQDKPKKIIKDLLEGGYDQKNGWKEWNKKFAGDNPKIAQEKIKEIQRVVFTKLGILKDPSAAIDGKLGPYTLAAMAAAAGNASVNVPIPNRNTKLSEYVANMSKRVAKTLKSKGKKVVSKYGKKPAKKTQKPPSSNIQKLVANSSAPKAAVSKPASKPDIRKIQKLASQLSWHNPKIVSAIMKHIQGESTKTNVIIALSKARNAGDISAQEYNAAFGNQEAIKALTAKKASGQPTAPAPKKSAPIAGGYDASKKYERKKSWWWGS